MAVNDRPHVLIVAGTDSSGGAGMARDIETVAAFGLRACVAVTAVTVQTHAGVRAIQPMAAAMVGAQMTAALESNPVAAIKTGMLAAPGIIAAIAGVLARHENIPVVLDPVLAASSGGSLLSGDAPALQYRDLFPRCTLLTPNLPELARLTGTDPAIGEDEAIAQANKLLERGARAVLVKGGHATGAEATDILVRPDTPPRRFSAPRLPGSIRGTGCMLASAIACSLAMGANLDDAVEKAKAYVLARIRMEMEAPA